MAKAKRIPLTKGKVALVDAADFERLNAFKWSALAVGKTTYAVRRKPKAAPKPKPKPKASKDFIKAAIKTPGSLTSAATKAGETPMAFAADKKNAPGKVGQRARFALLLQSFKHKKGGK